MSEVAARSSASRGRGSGRGGRGGFAGRGGRRANGDKTETGADTSSSAFEDEGEIGELRRLYGSKTEVIREMFPDWSEVDVLFALQETNGDENEAVTRIAEGTVSQWGEVSKAKKPSKPKAKDTPASTANNDSSAASGSRPSRGGRVASEGGRGRGRATDRGGRGGRGRATTAAPSAARKENVPLSVPTEEAPAWGKDTSAPATQVSEDKSAPQAATVTETPQSSAPQAKTWASMLQPKPAPKAAPKPQEPAAPNATEPVAPETATESTPVESEPQPADADQEATPIPEPAAPALTEPETISTPAITPSHDELTETNLEHVTDTSNATPNSAAQQQHQANRDTSSGFAASAIKATEQRAARTPAFQRRVLDQEEAVRMPGGNRDVDRATVQFGAFSLGDDEEAAGGREEAETRAQPPAESPVSHPRTALPPSTLPGASQDINQQKAGIPGSQGFGAATSAAPGAPGQPSIGMPSQQYGRFGQEGSQKPNDPFAQQAQPNSQPPYDSFPGQTSQAPSQQQQQPGGAFSSAPNDYSSYYTSNDRHPYNNNYYGHPFAHQQQGGQGQQDSAPGQQRPYGSYGASQQGDNLSQYPQSGVGIQNQPRFGAGSNDAQNSGHSTPNPTTQAAQQQGSAAPGSQPPSHAQQQYGYGNHPYYNNPYYQQYYSGYGGQGGFGPYGGAGKNAMYGQPYGMSPNAPFDHANSPASFAQSSLHRDSGAGSGISDYGRSGSGQAGGAPGLGGAGSTFGSVHDSFSRGSSSFQSQAPGFGGQAQQGNAAPGDDLKFGEAKSGANPSPSIGGARPGSAAASNAAASGQSGLPPPQSSQMGGGAYAGYPSHLQGHGGVHGSHAYGMGGAGGANQHANSPYGSYGQGGFGSGGYYGGNQQQQRGGWGGNYH